MNAIRVMELGSATMGRVGLWFAILFVASIQINVPWLVAMFLVGTTVASCVAVLFAMRAVVLMERQDKEAEK